MNYLQVNGWYWFNPQTRELEFIGPNPLEQKVVSTPSYKCSKCGYTKRKLEYRERPLCGGLFSTCKRCTYTEEIPKGDYAD